MEISEILKIVLEDAAFYETSGGGVTLGGGEPMAQPAAAIELLRACREAGIHTAMETCGHSRPDAVKKAAPYVNLFLHDIKHMDGAVHARLTGVDNSLILKNLSWILDNGHKLRARMPLVQGCNAELAEMEARAAFLEKWKGCDNFLGVDLLPYHKLGVHKYAQLGENYSLDGGASVPDEFLRQAVAIFGSHGIKASIVRH